ncbi:hypothetical protein RHSIM_Rhsim06G0223200 [Rhododendron simsii]|uniref:GrpE protein homolog n=1 Tax=Rhododendron simsii TaxID=118357 RepID=A0A834LK68_RHOSS|nr:hypothetical protein RHSIM_Rhsim06G0223200 [Rhododendron simsii]
MEVTNQKVESDSSLESQSAKRRRRHTKRIVFSDSDSESDLSREDLLKVMADKEELLKGKDKAIEMIVLQRVYWMLQIIWLELLLLLKTVSQRLMHLKTLLEQCPFLKTLLEGVDMTEKQLLEVFKTSGVEKYDPTNEQFDPNRHNAAFQVPDASKPPGTIAIVLKPGYMLHDRVLRPAEVGVTVDMANE